jgi:3-phytase/alkaline phosphatase D
LSGIAYDAHRGVYYALSDDRSQVNLARYYTVAIDLSDGMLDDGDVVFLEVTTLLDENREPYAPRAVDPEGIALPRPGQIFISSEGGASADPPIDPFVNRFNPDGKQTKAFPVPFKFLPDGTGDFGIRNNLAFESLASSPNMRYLFTATENALAQDGPRSGIDQESLSRILQYALNPGRPMAEYVYVTSAIPVPPDPPGAFADNGLVELVVLDNTGTLLALERSFAVGIGNTIKLFEVRTRGATDVSGIDDLYDEDTGTPADFVPADKRLIVDLADLGIDPDNVEGMTFGPILPDGRQTLILVSDNNFRPITQETQFIALALEIENVPGVAGASRFRP